MTKSEIMEFAIENYPKGTKFRSAYDPDRIGTVTITSDFYMEKNNLFSKEGIKAGEAIYYEHSGKLGEWAKIIEYGEEVKNEYSIY